MILESFLDELQTICNGNHYCIILKKIYYNVDKLYKTIF